MALPHAQPGEVVSLRPLGSALAQGQTAALIKSRQFEAVRLVLPSNKHVPSHSVPGQVTFLCLEGHVIIQANKEISLEAGDWLYLDRGAAHSITAVQDSSLLLTIHFGP